MAVCFWQVPEHSGGSDLTREPKANISKPLSIVTRIFKFSDYARTKVSDRISCSLLAEVAANIVSEGFHKSRMPV